MTVDFHVHSTASDGTLSPAEIVRRAEDAAFAALALTDHDNCDGIGEFLAAPGRATRRTAGIELSIEPGRGFDKFHLLCLGVDPANAELARFLARIREGRTARNARIIANFRRLGIEMEDVPPSVRPVSAYAHGDVLARPHFAKWLVDNAFASGVADAFARYLLPDSPRATRCYESRFRPDQEEAFRVVHAAGGLCVMAHPKYWRRAWRNDAVDYAAAARELARLQEVGLDALEARYGANTPDEDAAFAALADRLGLLKSAGSDFHGASKPTITLGMDVEESFIAPLLERLAAR